MARTTKRDKDGCEDNGRGVGDKEKIREGIMGKGRGAGHGWIGVWGHGEKEKYCNGERKGKRDMRG